MRFLMGKKLPSAKPVVLKLYSVATHLKKVSPAAQASVAIMVIVQQCSPQIGSFCDANSITLDANSLIYPVCLVNHQKLGHGPLVS